MDTCCLSASVADVVVELPASLSPHANSTPLISPFVMPSAMLVLPPHQGPLPSRLQLCAPACASHHKYLLADQATPPPDGQGLPTTMVAVLLGKSPSSSPKDAPHPHAL